MVASCALAGRGRTAGGTIDPTRFTLVDLTHDLAADAAAWPGSRDPLNLDTITASATGAMFRLTFNEHFATHLDAPRHASGTGWTNEQIPLERLVAPVVVIDVTAQRAGDRDYALTVLHLPSFGVEAARAGRAGRGHARRKFALDGFRRRSRIRGVVAWCGCARS